MAEDQDRPEGDLDDRLAAHILRLVKDCGPGKTICPSEAARAERGDDWRSLMKPVRRAAQKLARDGHIAIYRKGKPVDPKTVKGVIRLGLP
ncbi:MAG: DUF3253 domain-containing protein [Rhodospirillales bacterium]|nr:DUF3253 domain-containing protein [Rhodospirillales bacterium]MBO6785617.1 DUF3253 domain-containing protein [Rhodospirillales bacterium]